MRELGVAFENAILCLRFSFSSPSRGWVVVVRSSSALVSLSRGEMSVYFGISSIRHSIFLS